MPELTPSAPGPSPRAGEEEQEYERLAQWCDKRSGTHHEAYETAFVDTTAIARFRRIAQLLRAAAQGGEGDTPKHERGLYAKFNVRRNDGTDRPGLKHDGCEYFVLDLTHDPFAIPAIRAYSHACRVDFPALADDLDRIDERHAAEAEIQRLAPRRSPDHGEGGQK